MRNASRSTGSAVGGASAPRLSLPLRIVRRLAAHRALESAASIAFWFFLSVVPLLVLVGFLVGQVARSNGVDDLVGPLLTVVPATAEGLLRKEIERLARSVASSVAPLGMAGYLWTASSALHNLMRALEAVVSARRRPWWKARAIALAWVMVGLATACAVAWTLVKSDAPFQTHEPAARESARAIATHMAGGIAGGRPHHVHKSLAPPHEQAMAAVLLLIAGMALLAGFYRFAVERPPSIRRRVWPGTVTAVSSWLIVSWAFGAYAVSIADYTIYYGGLAAVTVLLLWLYLTSLALIVGAEVNAQAEGPQPAAR